MEKKPTIFSFLAQIFMIYGITNGLLNIFCLLFGEEASGFSAIFSLGSAGVSVAVSFQFLLVITIIVTLRFIFMTDCIIKNMPLGLRTVLMFAGALTATLAFIFCFGWFPADEPKAWIMFVVCFAISAAVSTFISVLNEKQENKKLEEALQKFKEGE